MPDLRESRYETLQAYFRLHNIPAELLQAGGETMIDVLLNICNKIWQTGEWPTPWTQSLVIYSSKERQPAPVSELSHN